MSTYLIFIISKNKKSLFNFLFFLFNNLKINSINKYTKLKVKKKIITVLKSPHVNKKFQEQFEIRSFSKQILVSSYNISKILIIFKLLKTKLFPDVSFKIKFLVNNKNSCKVKRKLFSPSNYVFKFNNYVTQKISFDKCKKYYTKNKRMKFIKKSKNFLKILDCYGELYFKTYV